MIRIFSSIVLLGLVNFSEPALAQDTAHYLKTRIVVDSLNIPWDMDWGPDNKIWFSERDGNISRIDPDVGKLERVYFIDDVYESFDNSGLHAFALHPEFPLIPYAYAHYTYRDYRSRLIRLTFDIAQDQFVEPLTLLDELPANASHNGSRIIFDEEGYLYLTTGDAYSPWEFSQNIESNGGKVLRMHDDGSVPDDNPFGNLVWSLGHRNAQGLVFSDKGILYSSEHGPSSDDELNIIEKGGNYGWPQVPGFCDLPSEEKFCDSVDVSEPLIAWTPTEAPCGIAYFNHPSIPEWENSILVAFLKQKKLKVVHLNEEGDKVLSEVGYFDKAFGRIRDVLVLPNGRVFICTSNQEPNGAAVVKEDDDKIIEIHNPEYSYPKVSKILNTQAEILFPNPVKNRLHIAFNDADGDPVSYVIYSVNGKVVKQSGEGESYFGNLLYVNVDDLQNGSYIIETSTSTGQVSRHKFQVLR